MGIEENIERIANALEAISGNQSRMLVIAEWNKARLERKDAPAEEETSVGQVPVHEWTYDELKAELLKRGVEVAKGTKMTTLLKFWERHKNDPEMQVAAAPAEAAGSAATAEDPFAETSAPVEPTRKPMTELDARKHIMEKGYKGTPEQIVVMKKALAFVGKAKFNELVEGEYDKLIAEFDRLMEAPHA